MYSALLGYTALTAGYLYGYTKFTRGHGGEVVEEGMIRRRRGGRRKIRWRLAVGSTGEVEEVKSGVEGSRSRFRSRKVTIACVSRCWKRFFSIG